MKHLTLSQRYKIEALLALNYSKSEMARQLGVDKSTVGRELKRHCYNCEHYDAEQAQQLYLKTKCQAGKVGKPVSDQLKEEIDKRIRKEFSPEQIAGQLTKQGKDSRSHSWIYLYIWKDKARGGDLYKHLRRANKKKRKKYGSGPDRRGSIKNRVSIEKRPKIVDELSRIGDWEADTIIGKDHKGALVSLTERRSMTQLLKKVNSKNAEVVTHAIIKMVKESNLPAFTMTFDNGKEFSYHEKIAKALKLDAYFAHPYSSYERGLNENQNGLVRQYIPKKSVFEKISQQQIKKIQDLLNIRPRKSLDYFSPKEFVADEIGVELNTKIDLNTSGWKSALVT